jgi:hypothetical protein
VGFPAGGARAEQLLHHAIAEIVVEVVLQRHVGRDLRGQISLV